MTGTLAAKGGGGAEGCHKAEENQMPATSQATGPHLCQGLWPGKDRDNGPSTESPSGTHPWVSGPRAETSQSFLVKLAACLLAGLDSLSDA